MKTSKLLRLLHLLSKKEQKAFGIFLQQQTNISKNAIDLYVIIEKANFKADSTSLRKEIVWQKLFGTKKKYDSRYLGALMSEICKVVEDFMIAEQLEKHKNFKQYLLLETLQDREAVEDFRQYYKRIIQQTNKQAQKLDIDLWQVLEHFERYSLLNKLRFACLILNQANVWKQDETAQQKADKMVEKAMREMQVFEGKENIIDLYYAVLCLQKSKAETDYFKLKNRLFDRENRLEKEELSIIVTIIANYCNRQIRAGQKKFLAEMFEIYQYMLAKGLLKNGRYIDPQHFKNMVTLGLRVGKLERIKQFIEDNRTKIAPKFSDSVYHYNLGVYYFYTENYQKSLMSLALMQRFDVFFELDYRTLTLKNYYELAEVLAFNDLHISFRRYVERQEQLTKNNKTAYYNFLKYAKLLFNKKMDKESIDKSTIDEIAKIDLLIERAWLLEKTKTA